MYSSKPLKAVDVTARQPEELFKFFKIYRKKKEILWPNSTQISVFIITVLLFVWHAMKCVALFNLLRRFCRQLVTTSETVQRLG